MQLIHLSDRTRLRFPARCQDFAHGVEIGMIAALMDLAVPSFTRKLSAGNLEQVRALADKMGYRLDEWPLEHGWTEVAFAVMPAQKPHLTLVYSVAATEG